MTFPNLNKNLTIGNYADIAIIRYEKYLEEKAAREKSQLRLF
jgi:hypothetical protein